MDIPKITALTNCPYIFWCIGSEGGFTDDGACWSMNLLVVLGPVTVAAIIVEFHKAHA